MIENIADAASVIERDDSQRQPLPVCRKCGGTMRPGIAIAQTFDCGDEGTCSPGGPGRVVECMKCANCGWSVT